MEKTDTKQTKTDTESLATPHNHEGRVSLKLPSGRKAVLKPYDAYVAQAIGDTALQGEGTAYDKAVHGCLEALDGASLPDWVDDRLGAINAVRNLHLNDYHYILFIACASFRDGRFEGDIPDDEGGTFFSSFDLFGKDGKPLEIYTPPEYPLGLKKSYSEEIDIPELGGKVTIEFDLLDGHARASMLDSGITNLNIDVLSRNPRWTDPKRDNKKMPYRPNERPHPALSIAITKAMRKVDPVIQYTVKSRTPKGKTIQQSIFGIPDFFLRGFI